MYVDESGDPGSQGSPSEHFILSGLVIHESQWITNLEQLISFRQRMRSAFGLLMREEIHAAHFISRPGSLSRIARNDRLSILRHFADELASMTDINIINVVVSKYNKPHDYNIFNSGWMALIQGFSNTISSRNFPGSKNSYDDNGMIIPDNTDVKKLTQLLRRMRRYNPIPNMQSMFGTGYRNLTVRNLIEDPYFKRSDDSYFIQAADLAAYLLYQHITPNKYMQLKGGHRHFDGLEPILCRQASHSDPRGIVWL
jgi:hypothetical protein